MYIPYILAPCPDPLPTKRKKKVRLKGEKMFLKT